MKKILAISTLLAGLLFATSAKADTYQGGGYTVTIGGADGEVSYRGCDDRGNCLYIPQVSFRQRGSLIWENSGYTYNMSPLGTNDGRYRLKVFAPNGNVILNVEMSPVATSSSERISELNCVVTNLQSGQLALRRSPGGEAIAGLDNDNIVRYLRGSGDTWVYVRVIRGPNSRVNGKEGWVNFNYLECLD
ncbi:SH3 domain-containing protein [Oscillatoria sp. FACHB-1406]|uniref:SH3 domain-containing protein n=1 Tax=Oscillatoria sp. FACHB-1406 TaxID=2692846 RepID=UPI001684DD73|nr:SH3 domain-containing protein [Oscillatoria sp. FACHB-1406]MBD2579236.1 SH3 domain-containing protein [Oscillatoria sp. FACHB-1406]